MRALALQLVDDPPDSDMLWSDPGGPQFSTAIQRRQEWPLAFVLFLFYRVSERLYQALCGWLAAASKDSLC